MNRKLIRPDLTEMKDHRHTPVTTPKYFRQRRVAPPDQTNAESNYYLKQMANKTRMVIILKDGEELRARSSGTTGTPSRSIARTRPTSS